MLPSLLTWMPIYIYSWGEEDDPGEALEGPGHVARGVHRRVEHRQALHQHQWLVSLTLSCNWVLLYNQQKNSWNANVRPVLLVPKPLMVFHKQIRILYYVHKYYKLWVGKKKDLTPTSTYQSLFFVYTKNCPPFPLNYENGLVSNLNS